MSTPETLEAIRKKYPKRLTRGKAIKLYCKEQCCCGDLISWKDCSQTGCFLWNFRQGKEIVEKDKTSHKNNSIVSKKQEGDGVNDRE